MENKEYLIFKSGRGWYRENSQGYTNFIFDAGRYSLTEVMAICQPNGEDGSRDGTTFKHQDEINHDYVSKQMYALQAENQRLREALLKIAKGGALYGDSVYDYQQVARKALEASQ